ncbi:hypothetical protein QYE76_061961 [Lolium multiflorum]|uniref:Uncharacterized protein n=1 Tax=Lolium multiflorum TaxID=4521 RepID=A0AAD8S374_LOLMU|nr:hypothetical protein QYE76_061961 [Lolium multiflorum]
MGTEKGEVRRQRGALTARLTCPLCKDLFREACAFTECLHTCRSRRSAAAVLALVYSPSSRVRREYGLSGQFAPR